MDYRIDNFVDDNGNCNIELFLKELEKRDKKLVDKIYTWIKKLENKENIRYPKVENVGKDLYSLRIPKKGGTPRIFFCINGKEIYLLCGIIKKDDKIRDHELNQAYNLLKKCKERIKK